MSLAGKSIPQAAQTMEEQFRAMLQRHGAKPSFSAPRPVAAPPSLSAGGHPRSVIVTTVSEGKFGLLNTILKYAKWVTALVVIIAIVVVIYIISKKYFGGSDDSGRLQKMALQYSKKKQNTLPPPPEYAEGNEENYEEEYDEEPEESYREYSDEEDGPEPVALAAEENSDPNFTLLKDL